MSRPSGRIALRWATGLLLLIDSSSTALSSTARSFTGALPSATARSFTGALPPAAAATSTAGPDRAAPYADLAALARARLDCHVDAPALSAWRDTCKAAEAQAFDLLFAWLPSSDLAAWRADRVIADIRLALATRAAARWGDLVDEETFLRFVLPHRVAQEPVEPWRTTLHDLLWPRVRDLSLPEAILETNRFCREWATFQPSSARDQAPSATMTRGLGRCEEEMIFFVCAARSVGIPARPCYTPWWTASDDNHAWVEAWAGDGWHYLGACEPEAELDRAWFTGPARRAGLVLSVAYGEQIPRFGLSATEVYSHGRGVTLVNSTGVYTTAGRATARWVDLDPAARAAPPVEAVPPVGAVPPADGADTLALWRAKVPITIHVFNSGSLVPLGTFDAGDTITLGPQDYFASCSVDDRPAGAFLTVHPGETTVISFDPRGGEEALRALFARPFTLRIPEPPAATARIVPMPLPTPAAVTSASTQPPPDTGGGSPPGVVPADIDSLGRTALVRETAQRRAASMRADSLRRVVLSAAWRARDRRGADAVLDHLADVPPCAAHWLSFLLSATPREAADARALVLEMDDKDFLEADSAGATATLRESRRVRSIRAAQTACTASARMVTRSAWSNQAAPDSIWYRYVLSPRIGDQPFDPGLWTTLPLFTDKHGRLSEAQAILAAFAARVRRDEPKRLGHLARPSETWASGWATPVAARVGLTGLFRRNGIPARLEAEGRWVEAWRGGRWIPCDPFDAASWDRREGAVASATGTPGHLRAVVHDGARVMTQAEPGRHFRLARFTEGRFSTLHVEYPVKAGVLNMDLEPGSWWLMGGVRGTDGAPRGRAIPFTLAAGESISVDLDLGTTAEPAHRTRLPATLRARAGDGPVLLFAWKPGAEPSIRTATALAGALTETSARGVKIVSMPLVPEGSSSPASGLPGPGKPGTGMSGADFPRGVLHRPISDADLAPLFEISADTELPVLLLADRDGAVLLRLAGMRPDAADRVRNALSRLDASGLARPE
jgi:aryl carrier-like protein